MGVGAGLRKGKRAAGQGVCACFAGGPGIEAGQGEVVGFGVLDAGQRGGKRAGIEFGYGDGKNGEERYTEDDIEEGAAEIRSWPALCATNRSTDIGRQAASPWDEGRAAKRHNCARPYFFDAVLYITFCILQLNLEKSIIGKQIYK